MDALSAWRNEHARFALLLRLFAEQTSAFHRGEQPNYDLMRDIVFYMRTYADRLHHPREEAAFDILERRAPTLVPTIARLRAEHGRIAAAGDELYRQLETILEDVMVERSTLEQRAGEFLAAYEGHMATEDDAVLPAARDLLAPADWAAVAAAVPGLEDPLFGAEAIAPLRGLRAQIDREAGLPMSS